MGILENFKKEKNERKSFFERRLDKVKDGLSTEKEFSNSFGYPMSYIMFDAVSKDMLVELERFAKNAKKEEHLKEDQPTQQQLCLVHWFVSFHIGFYTHQ